MQLSFRGTKLITGLLFTCYAPHMPLNLKLLKGLCVLIVTGNDIRSHLWLVAPSFFGCRSFFSVWNDCYSSTSIHGWLANSADGSYFIWIVIILEVELFRDVIYLVGQSKVEKESYDPASWQVSSSLYPFSLVDLR